jgi:peptidoglycan-associated lipoprotein
MSKVYVLFAALLCVALSSAAQKQLLPSSAGLRYSEQVSNGPAGSCGCFTMQGMAADSTWTIRQLPSGGILNLTGDFGLENTPNIHGDGYGLTLTTYTAGPRFTFATPSSHPFVQALFGLAHGTDSEFPSSGNNLKTSANSFALDLSAGLDYTVLHHLSLRVAQVDYLRTALPNNSNNWQNNLRISAGITLRFQH